MLTFKEHITNNDYEVEYSKLTSLEHRKKYAQFFTPFQIAELMSKWLLGNKNLKTILEPAFGLGIFSRVILLHNKNIKIKGYEIDSKIYEIANTHFQNNRNISISLQDYMFNDWENKYDGIICNPPYFKFHDYDNKNILKEIETKLSYKFSGFTNLYTLFLLKSLYQLNSNGRLAYIIPSEFLNSDYGELVKSYLIQSKTLRHIIVINFEENVFNDALTTASILFCANDNNSTKIQFSNINNLNDLNIIDSIIDNYPNHLSKEQLFNINIINPNIKWRAYYQKQNAIKYKHLIPFKNYGKVVRGIATGSNDYFTFNISKAKKHGINSQYLLPCICKSIDFKNSFFLDKDFETLQNNDKNIFLLNAIIPLDENIKKYLRLGEEQGIDKLYLTSCRNPWYALENRPPSPIWVTVFNRNGLRFIRNEANISNLTTFHCIYPVTTDMYHNINIDLLFAYLLTNVAKEIFEDNSREYGNGLQKFEPNDINKGKILDLEQLNIKTQNEILELYNQYRETIIYKNPDESIINEINKIFLNNYT